MHTIQRNIPLLKIDAFLSGLWPLSALTVIYFEQITHSYALAMLVWSLSAITQTLTEIPTGIFSDKIGRRRTLMLAAASIILCFTLWALAGQLHAPWLLFIGAICWGLSDSFLSGTQEALIYETMAELNKPKEFAILYAKINFWMQFSLAISAVFAAIITYCFSLQALAWLSVLPIAGQLVTAYLFVEPKRTTKQHQVPSLSHFLIALKNLWVNKKLRFYAFFIIFYDSIAYAYTRIEAAYFQTLIKDWMINIMRFIKQVSGMIGFMLLPHLRRFTSVRLFFFAITLNEFLRAIGVALNNALSPIIMSLVNIGRGLALPSKNDILQQEFSADQRATMQSIMEAFKGIFGAVIAYLLGFFADLSGPRIVIISTVGIKFALIFGAMFLIQSKKKKT